MPIADSELDKTTNAYILQPADHTIHRALQIWRNTPTSFEWWWLIIEHGDQQYTALRFETLRETLSREYINVNMNMRLGDLPAYRDNPADWDHPFPGVVTPKVIERDEVGTARALQIMRNSPGRVLIVLRNGLFYGILSSSERIFAFTDKPLLDMLDEFEQHGDTDTLILPPRERPADNTPSEPEPSQPSDE
ncbi:MAG: hypothetical protein JW966_01795 [Anaerolineae bacterium]|nr:hypothetical protein [Anaerolineae bacterium]